MAIAGLSSLSINSKSYLVKEFSYKLPTINQDYLKALQQVTDVTSYEPETGEMEITYYIGSGETSGKYNQASGVNVVATLRDGTIITLKSGIVIGAPEPDIQNKVVKITLHSNNITEQASS